MRKKTIFLTSLLTLVSLFIVYGQSDKPSEFDLKGLEVKIKPAKLNYILGEPVLLDFEIINNTSSDLHLPGTNLGSGYLMLSIAFPDDKFRKYSAVGTVKKTSPVSLKKGETAKSSSKILWNASRAENSSNPKPYEETDVLTYYAFPKPGVYSVKATLGIPSNENPITIESEPIQITIEEPTGEDLEVWNIIRDREDIGFFIQEAYVRGSEPEKKEKTLRDIEQIVNQYPNSSIAKQLEQSFKRFKENEEQREKYLQRRKQNE